MNSANQLKNSLKNFFAVPTCRSCGAKLDHERNRFSPDLSDYNRTESLITASTTVLVLGILFLYYGIYVNPSEGLAQAGLYASALGLTIYAGVLLGYISRSTADGNKIVDDLDLQCAECMYKELERKRRKVSSEDEVRLRPLDSKNAEFEGVI